jgi:hypothetical protein
MLGEIICKYIPNGYHFFTQQIFSCFFEAHIENNDSKVGRLCLMRDPPSSKSQEPVFWVCSSGTTSIVCQLNLMMIYQSGFVQNAMRM